MITGWVQTRTILAASCAEPAIMGRPVGGEALIGRSRSADIPNSRGFRSRRI
jgi:hypothetical protein